MDKLYRMGVEMMPQEQLLNAIKERIGNATIYCESSVIDYKVKPHDISKNKCEFLKDVLSLLNSWERPDEDRFLIYGVEDKNKKPIGYSDENRLDDATIQTLITNHISPRPVVEFHQFNASQILDSPDESDKLFGCLYIPASNFGKIYEIGKAAINKVQDKNDRNFRRLEIGTSFFRYGSQVEPLTQKHREEMMTIRKRSEGFNPDFIVDEYNPKGFPIIFLASIIGSWDESVEGDRCFIENLSDMSYGQFIAAIRKQSFRNDELVSSKGSVWNIDYRASILTHFSSHLDRSLLLSLIEPFNSVFRDIDEMLNLKSDKAFLAALNGVTSIYSSSLKQGIARFLAIIGTNSNICHCPKQVVQQFIFTLQTTVLSSNNWKTIACSEDILQVLSEAFPEGFLILVGQNSIEGTGLTDYLFQIENGNLNSFHRQYLFDGIRLAAIDENLFSLGMSVLQKIHPFSKAADKAMEALLIPWCPQTTASAQIRKGASESLLRCGAWTTLIHLFPKVRNTGEPIVKPEFRQDLQIPSSVSSEDYWIVSKAYVLAAINYANGKVAETIDLIEHISSISVAGYIDEFISSVQSTCIAVDKINALKIWSALEAYSRKCNKYIDAPWRPKREDVIAIDKAVEMLRPADKLCKAIYLFSLKDYEFIDGDSDDELEKLRLERIAALDALFESGSEFDETFELLSFHCADKQRLGEAMAESKSAKTACENIIYSAIKDKNEVASGFIFRNYQLERRSYLLLPQQREWGQADALAFYCLLPCNQEVWQEAENFLKERSTEYWRRAPICLNVETTADSNHVLAKYLEATRCCEALIFGAKCIKNKLAPDTTLLFECIKNYSPDPNLNFKVRYLNPVFKYLSEGIAVNELAREQFRLYPLLNDKDNLELHRQMSQHPELFSKIFRLAFRKDDCGYEAINPSSRAEEILQNWRSIPGDRCNGYINVNFFHSWVTQVVSNLTDEELVPNFYEQLGKCLFHAPVEEELFINVEIAKFLEENEEAQSGYAIEAYNSVGAVIGDGKGTVFKELSNHYLSLAGEVESKGLYRFGAALRGVSRDFIQRAEREIMVYKAATDNE